jgi:hypothetical protein
MKRTYHGSCHCGALRFEADLDLSQGSGRCNCSFCAKARNWSVIVKPDAFRLLAGDGDISTYQFGTRMGEHQFCRHCGLRPFSRGDVPEIGGAYVSISLSCLDDVEPAELAEVPIKYMDGRNNNWWNAPAETRHL